MSNYKKLSLAKQIFLGLGLGILAGLGFMAVGRADIAINYVKPFGSIFLNLIKLIVVPVVLCSIISGVISLQDVRKVGSIGIRTLLYYLCTTAFAVLLGLGVAHFFRQFFPLLETSQLSYSAAESSGFMNTLLNIFPSNILQPMVNANMLQIIVIALLFGFGILLSEEKGQPMATLINSLSEVSMSVMSLILKLSPMGVFALICPVIAENGPAILGSLLVVLLAAYFAYLIHMALIYSGTVKIFADMNPLSFFKGMFPAMILAFSSSSSVGALPLNKSCCEKLGARKEVSSFVIPLGATINMDGTAIYQGICAVFIASCFGIELTLTQMLTIVLTATLASIGTAGVPGSGMIMLAMVLQSVGLPVEGIALVAGIDRIFDMGRTVVNITGDAACALMVSKLEDRKERKCSEAKL